MLAIYKTNKSKNMKEGQKERGLIRSMKEGNTSAAVHHYTETRHIINLEDTKTLTTIRNTTELDMREVL